MSVVFPEGFRIEPLRKAHNRRSFDCGLEPVNDWLRRHARQSQNKHLSTTRVLLDESSRIAGFYSLAYGQVHMDKLPDSVAKRLPNVMVPVVVLGWLGVDKQFRGNGLGDRLLAHSLMHAHQAAQIIPFAGVVIDCLNGDAKRFYQRYDFAEFPGHPMKLLVTRHQLEAMAS